jgi:hypothetical protein
MFHNTNVTSCERILGFILIILGCSGLVYSACKSATIFSRFLLKSSHCNLLKSANESTSSRSIPQLLRYKCSNFL